MEGEDQRYIDAVVPWCKRRDGWALPGGDLTRVAAVAMSVAKRISQIIDKRDTSHAQPRAR